MPVRHLPVAPDLDQLKHQAKDLLRAIRRGDPEAIAELHEFHPHPPSAHETKLADAQLVLARSYQASSWPRLVQACKLIDAIWADDLDTVIALVDKHPNLLHENAGIRNNNWGPPLSYAANVGRDRIIKALHARGATDLRHALDRAVLQSKITTARMLHEMLGSPTPSGGAFGSAAYTLSISGTQFLFDIGAKPVDEAGNPDAPVDVVLQSDSRRPDAKHAILEMYVAHGFELPDTPMMALHRGRLDLLDAHLRRDPSLIDRPHSFAEIFPPELKCMQPAAGGYDEHLPRTPLAGGTLLQVAIEFDELEIARWLMERGADVNARAAVDAKGFGGHTAMFNAVVSYPHFWLNFLKGGRDARSPRGAAFVELLLEHGADPNPRASFREVVTRDGQVEVRDHRNVTPLAWAAAFASRLIVSIPAVDMLVGRGGHG